MDARKYWLDYVERNGGLVPVSDKLDIPYQTLASISNGHRGIGRKLAERMVTADPTLDASILIWIRNTKGWTEAASRLPITPSLSSVGAGRVIAFGTPDEIRKLLSEYENERS